MMSIQHTTNVYEMYKYRGYIIDGPEIYIPEIKHDKPISYYMLPQEDIDPKYFETKFYEHRIKGGIATTIPEYRNFLTKWYTNGLCLFAPVFDSKVKGTNNLLLFRKYLQYIFASTDCEQAHTFAYMAYVLDTCCVKLKWQSN